MVWGPLATFSVAGLSRHHLPWPLTVGLAAWFANSSSHGPIWESDESTFCIPLGGFPEASPRFGTFMLGAASVPETSGRPHSYLRCPKSHHAVPWGEQRPTFPSVICQARRLHAWGQGRSPRDIPGHSLLNIVTSHHLLSTSSVPVTGHQVLYNTILDPYNSPARSEMSKPGSWRWRVLSKVIQQTCLYDSPGLSSRRLVFRSPGPQHHPPTQRGAYSRGFLQLREKHSRGQGISSSPPLWGPRGSPCGMPHALRGVCTAGKRQSPASTPGLSEVNVCHLP